MAQFKCCYSSLEITTSHFPLYLSNRDPHLACHPIFHAPQKSLLSYARKWSAGELTHFDSYLLYLALLKSTDLVYFRTAAIYVPQETTEVMENGVQRIIHQGTDAVVANNMEALMIAVSRINAISAPSVGFPEVVITQETRTLYNSKHWIAAWLERYKEYHEGVRKQEVNARQAVRETALHKLIKSPHRKLESYAMQLAEWADDACSFPTYDVLDPLTPAEERKPIPLNEYYKRIIVHAAAKEYFKINIPDLRELIDTLNERMEFSIEKGENAGGSIQSYLIFKLLEEAVRYLKGFIQPGSISATKLRPDQTWNFADDDAEEDGEEFIEGINAIIAAAPIIEPLRKDYVTQGEYIRAKIKWSVASDARKNAPAKPDNLGLGF